MRALAFVVLMVLLAWVSIPLGSYRPVSLGIVVIAGALGVLLLSLRGLRSGEHIVRERSNFLVPAVLIGAIVVWQILLLIPVPNAVLSLIAPTSFSAYSQAAGDPTFRVSVDAAATMRQVMLWGAFFLIFVLLSGLVQSSKQMWILSVVIVSIVVAQAIGGLLLGFLGVSFVPEQYIDGHFTRIRGSFVNANHFAGFVNLGIGLLIGAFVALAPEQNSRGVVQANTSTRGRVGAELMLLVVAALMTCAVVMSGSRGAVLGLAAAALMLVVCTLGTRRRARERRRALVVLFSVVGLGILVVLFASSGARLTDSDGISERLWMWSIARDAAMAQPLTGFGSGTFQWLPGLFAENLPRDVSYDDAHNLFMETLAEQGLIGLGLLLAFFIAVVVSLLKGLATQSDTTRVAIIIGVLCGGCAIVVQSMVDFQFEVPANGVFFVAAIALALAAADPVWTGDGNRRGRRRG